MTLRHILIMLEAYVFMLFCVPLPVICIGNAVGLAATSLLILCTVYFDSLVPIIASMWQYGTFTQAVMILLATVIFAAVIYLIIINFNMLRCEHRSPPCDIPCTVIVLGCRVKGTRPTRMLRRRLETAYRYLCRNPQAVCIVSGGKGADEMISEAEAMHAYLLKLGLDPSRIYTEDKSTSTLENLRFSCDIIRAENLPKEIATATDGFHQYRTRLLARSLSTDVYAISAATEPRYALTYRVREWFGLTAFFCKTVN